MPFEVLCGCRVAGSPIIVSRGVGEVFRGSIKEMAKKNQWKTLCCPSKGRDTPLR